MIKSMKKTFNVFSILLISILTINVFLPSSRVSATPAGGQSILNRYYNGVDHLYTIDPDSTNLTGYSREISLGAVYSSKVYDSLSPIYQYYNGIDLFYTSNWDELGAGKNGYTYEGIAFYSSLTSNAEIYATSPVHRYYNGIDHFYTNNFSELGYGNNSYTYEGIAFYVSMVY